MRIRILLIILSLSYFGESFAQNSNFSSLPMFNQMYYNPGYAGDGNDIEAKLLVRNQWMNMPEAPNTVTFNVDAPFKLFGHSHGAGISIAQENIGNFVNTEFNVAYAYRKSLVQGELGLGVGLFMLSHSFETNWLDPEGGTGQGDGGIPQNASYQPFLIDANIGIYYKADNLYMSLSSRNFTESKVKYLENEGESTTSNTKQVLIGRQMFFSTGYDYQLPNPMFSIQPGAFIASDFSSTQLSVSGIVTYNKRFYGGLSYKNTDAITVISGIDLPSGIHASVAYDIITSRIINHSLGSFEFMVGYKFSLDIDKDNRKYKSVRFL